MKALSSLLVAALVAGAMASASAADAPFVNAQTVRQAQKVLNDRGFRTGGVDGHMGPQTEAALVNFQRAEKLQPTGKPDRQTIAALGLNKSNQSAQGTSGHYPPSTTWASKTPLRRAAPRAARRTSPPPLGGLLRSVAHRVGKHAVGGDPRFA